MEPLDRQPVKPCGSEHLIWVVVPKVLGGLGCKVEGFRVLGFG